MYVLAMCMSWLYVCVGYMYVLAICMCRLYVMEFNIAKHS